MSSMSSIIWLLFAASIFTALWEPTTAWTSVVSWQQQQQHRQQQWRQYHDRRWVKTTTTELSATTKGKQSRSTVDTSPEVAQMLQDEETPAGVEGAQFFGGNKQKEEFFDPVAEAQASVIATTTTDDTDIMKVYDRFRDKTAFPDEAAAQLAQDLQSQVNAVLYVDAGKNDDDDDDNNAATTAVNQYTYATTLIWDTPLQKTATGNPLQELDKALEFYNRVDLAITSAKTLLEANNVVELRWELSLAWPTVWEPRVLLTGTSKLSLDGTVITKQEDFLDMDLSNNLFQQLVPRFWDIYHIGMTPSAETSPRLTTKKPSLLAGGYNLYQLPPRLYLQPTLLDRQDREQANAGTIPNHAFSCIIKTMGPQRQRYETVSPVQVQILPSTETNARQIVWNIPLAVEYLTNNQIRLPPPNEEAVADSDPTCRYVWQPRRLVATVSYGGNGPQDAEIANVRKRLYESVVRDGLQPKLDENGRPIFFFWQNAVKACYTEEGLGMAVYEWRPRLAKSNEVGIELEWNE